MKITIVDPKSLTLDKDQPRESLDTDHVEDISRKMQHEGFDPRKFLTVRKTVTGIWLVQDGAHRCVGAVDAGLKEIPVFIIEEDSELTEQEIAELRLDQCADNMGRPMKPMEIIRTCETAIQAGVPIEEIAGKMGKTALMIQKDRILAQCPGRLQSALQDGELGKSVVIHIAEAFENKLVKNAEKCIQKAKSGGKTASSQVKAFDKYVQEVVQSNAARSGNLFAKDGAETEKVLAKKDPQIICIHNSKDFTLNNAESYFKQLTNAAMKYKDSPLGNGHADAIMRVSGKTAFEVETTAKALTAIAKKLMDVSETYKVANA